MTSATGTHSIADLSSRDLQQAPQTRAYPQAKRQLLTGEPRPLPFTINFPSGDSVEVSLIGSGEEPSSHWRIFAALKQLAQLERNWDSYGALPLNPRAVRRSVGLLASIVPAIAPEPTVVPTRDGGVQFEWHRRGIDVEVKVPPAGDVEFLIATSEVEIEDTGIPDRDQLLAVFTEMASA